MAKVSENTLSNWYAACHVLRSKKLLNSEFKIGGEGHIVEIDKTRLKRKSNTQIHSDKFATYVAERGSRVYTLANIRMFAGMHYEHSWENHTLNFVDPLAGTSANTIEGLWEMQIKRHIKAMRGMSNDYLDGYINEYMRRSWFFSMRASPGEYMCVLVQTVIRYPKEDK
ncbi:hypothetical protein PI124_g3735 [Phytophthora idaei]|nr:hypothetical protein PI124_g3735 [Phytophthora idaei]